MAQQKKKKKAPPKKKKKKKSNHNSSTYITVAIIVCAFILGALTFYFIGKYQDSREAATEVTPIAKKLPTPTTKPKVEPTEKVKPEVVPPPPSYKYSVAIVIDDMGQNLARFKELLKIDAPINIAVLPFLKHSKQVAREAHDHGWNVLLHVPMEPMNVKIHNPGKGALLTSMNEKEIRKQLERDIKAIPHLIGMNNHMGSKFTANKKLMKVVLEYSKKKGLFFLDSRTTNRSVAASLATSIGVPTAKRNIFLDNKQDKDYIRAQIAKLIQVAKKNGTAIGIGHPHAETVAVLREVAGDFEDEGIRLVKIENLVK